MNELLRFSLLSEPFHLDGWLIIPKECEVRNTGNEDSIGVKISPRSMEVLLSLAESAGKVVLIEDILAVLWKGRNANPNAVQKCVTEIRHAFQDDVKNPRVIHTVHKRGYKLMLEPKFDPNSSANYVPLNVPAGKPAAPHPSGFRIPLALGLVGVLVAGTLGFAMWSQDWKSCNAEDGNGVTLCDDASPTSVAVLPFTVSGIRRHEDRYTSHVFDTLVGSLLEIPHLTVASRNDSIKQSLDSSTSRNVAKNLGVEHIFTGNLSIVDKQVELSVQLIAANSGTELYSSLYVWEDAAAKQVPDEITTKIMDSLKVHLHDAQREIMLLTGTNNAEAFLEMQRSRRALNTENVSDLTRAAEYARNALVLDPQYEGAYRCLIVAYELKAQYVSIEQNKFMRQEVAKIVIELEDLLPDSEVYEMARHVEASLGNDRLKIVTELVHTLKKSAGAHKENSRVSRAYALFGQELLRTGLIKDGDAYRRQYFLARDIPYEVPLSITYQNGGTDALIDRRKEIIARGGSEVVSMLAGLTADYAREGDFQQAQKYLMELERQDEQGLWAHNSRHTVNALQGKLTKGSVAYNEFVSHPMTGNINKGIIAFINGDVVDGIEFWDNLAPSERRILSINLLFMEHNYTDSVLHNEAYLALKDRLGVGPKWRDYLTFKVAELVTFTGIEPSGEFNNEVSIARLARPGI